MLLGLLLVMLSFNPRALSRGRATAESTDLSGEFGVSILAPSHEGALQIRSR